MAAQTTGTEPAAGHVVRRKAILGSEPTLRGTRVPVRAIVLAQRQYPDTARIKIAFPMLSVEEIKTALAFYDAHRDEIERYIAENELQDDA